MFQEVETKLNEKLQLLLGEAKTRAMDYWDEHRRQNKIRPRWERGKVTPRVRITGGALVIQWVVKRYAQGKYMSDHIKKGKRYPFRYQMGAFKSVAKNWELELIEEMEDDFELYRRASKGITEARGAMRRLASLYGVEIDKCVDSPVDDAEADEATDVEEMEGAQ